MNSRSPRSIRVLQLIGTFGLIGMTGLYAYFTYQVAKKTGVEKPYVEHYLVKKDSEGHRIKPPNLSDGEIEKEKIELLFVIYNTYQTPATDIKLFVEPYFISKDGGIAETGNELLQEVQHLGSFETKEISLTFRLKHHVLGEKRRFKEKHDIEFRLHSLRTRITYKNAFTGEPYTDPYKRSTKYVIRSQ